jgi:hypothetical protein
MTIDEAIKLSEELVCGNLGPAVGYDLARWILETFEKHADLDIPEPQWGLGVVEIFDNMCGTFDPDEATAIGALLIRRAEEAREV